MEKIPDISISNLCDLLDAKIINSNLIISHLTINSKEKSFDNFCYIAIKGKKFDGHDFINEAINNGAKAIISEKPFKTRAAIVIIVKNSVEALGKIAKFAKRTVKTICITGSVGKSTVSRITSNILKEKYKVNSTEKNYNNEIGVPLTLLKSRNHDINVVELGMRNRGEIAYLSSLCEPDIGVITNIGTAHLGMLGSREEIFNAKTEILAHTKEYIIVPNEEKFKKINFGNIRPIFIGKNGDCFINKYKFSNEGLEFSIVYNNRIYENLKIRSFSLHNLTNAMYGIVVGFINSLNIEEIKRGLLKYEGENLREEIIEINGITVINDCYNASFESMKSAILLLSQYAKMKNKIPKAFIGDMLELGDYSAELHYRIGEFVKDCGIERLFVIGKYAKFVMDGYFGGTYIDSIDNSANTIIKSLSEKDVLLVKGSRSLELERFINQMRSTL
jgi:UDP-N-acetylmuramoyl-tripeptide--D-alanyl-D-alanine ligase